MLTSTLITLLGEARWTPGDQQAFSTTLAHCLRGDTRLIPTALQAVKSGIPHGQKAIVDVLINLTQKDTLLQVELESLFTMSVGDLPLWIVTGLRHRPSSDRLRIKLCLLALDHKDPRVVAEGIYALARDVGFDNQGFDRVTALKNHTAPVVTRAVNDYMANRKLRENLKFGSILAADYSDNRIVEFDENGKEVFTIEEIFGVWDVEPLANGNLLITEFSVNRVSEVTRENRVVWSFDDLKNPYDADRLPNGNTLLTIRMLNEVREVDKNGTTVWRLRNLSSPSDADRLPNGATMVAENGFVRVFSPAGSILWKKKVTWAVEVTAVIKKK